MRPFELSYSFAIKYTKEIHMDYIIQKRY